MERKVEHEYEGLMRIRERTGVKAKRTFDICVLDSSRLGTHNLQHTHCQLASFVTSLASLHQ